MRRQIDSAESTTNSATSSAAEPVTTNTFQQPADAVTFSIKPASQWASCKADNQKNRPRDPLQTARDVTEPRCLIHVAGYNLGLLMRLLTGAGTPWEFVRMASAWLLSTLQPDGVVIVMIFVAADNHCAHPPS
jgi:hypothetical protein